MTYYHEILAPYARAHMEVPAEPIEGKPVAEAFSAHPRWRVFCLLHMGIPKIDPFTVGENAAIIGRLPLPKLTRYDLRDFVLRGVQLTNLPDWALRPWEPADVGDKHLPKIQFADREHADKVVAWAYGSGILDRLMKQFLFLDEYAGDRLDSVRLGKDFAPQSFAINWYRKKPTGHQICACGHRRLVAGGLDRWGGKVSEEDADKDRQTLHVSPVCQKDPLREETASDFWFNGGLIFHEPGRSGAEYPTLSVTLEPTSQADWSVHT